MKKIKSGIILCLLGILFSANIVNASDDGYYKVVDEASLEECFKNEITCRLQEDLTITSAKDIKNELVLDLNGHSLIASKELNLKSGLITVHRGGKLIINDSKGTGKISTGKDGNVWAGIQLIKDNDSNEVAELIVNGGTIEGYYYAITGNGNYPNSKITINSGKIEALNKEDSLGIYHPQKGEIIVNGGEIRGGTGIEMRSGTLLVNNGTIEGIAPKFVKMVNKNGSTTNGVGIAVAQHTTKNAINVSILNGNISGQYAFYEWNPHENSKEDLNKIKLNISGGEFTGTAEGVLAVYSENFTEFISGGKFNTKVTEYLTENAQVTSNNKDNDSSVFKETNTNKTQNVWLLLISVIFLGAGAFIFYKKKEIFINIKR